jgi:FkbM family methyltransferase
MLPDLKRTLRDVTKSLLPRSIFQGVVRPAVRVIYSLIYGRRGYKINIGGQGEFRMSPDLAFRGWERFGDRHNWAFARCIDSCKGESVFLDVGAHVGLYSLPVSRALAAGGRVFAFEPSRGSYGYLIKNVAYNGFTNIETYNLVVADSESPGVPFYERTDPDSATSGLTMRTKDSEERYVLTQVPKVSLDSFCDENHVAPDVIKIDTEGSELFVLKGARAVLARRRPLIFLSVHPSHLRSLGQSTEEVVALLSELGYEINDKSGGTVTSLGSGEYICVPMNPRQTPLPTDGS